MIRPLISLVVACSIFTASAARADGPMDFQQAQKLDDVALHTRAKSTRAAGRALTAIGVLAYAAAVPLAVWSGFVDEKLFECCSPTEKNPNKRPAMIASGALFGLMAVGITTGPSLMAKADRMERKQGLMPPLLSGWTPERVRTERRAGQITLGIGAALSIVGITWWGIQPQGTNFGAGVFTALGGAGAVTGAGLWSRANRRGDAIAVSVGATSVRIQF